jgi:hypothetical protein
MARNGEGFRHANDLGDKKAKNRKFALDVEGAHH